MTATTVRALNVRPTGDDTRFRLRAETPDGGLVDLEVDTDGVARLGVRKVAQRGTIPLGGVAVDVVYHPDAGHTLVVSDPRTMREVSVDAATADACGLPGPTVAVCGEHGEHLAVRASSICSRVLTQWWQRCVLCQAGVVPDTTLRDRWGNPICGADFMAGTICTDLPGHGGPHSPTCQRCGGDWYASTCGCPDG